MTIYIYVLMGLALALVMFGCFKFGAEFCPPTVVIQHEDGSQSGVRLIRDGGRE